MNAIQICIQAVDDRITQLQTLRASLVACQPLMADTPAVNNAVAKPATKPEASAGKQRGPYKKRTAQAEQQLRPTKTHPWTERKQGSYPSVAPKATTAAVTKPTTTTQALLDGKATSVGGAMKVYIRQHPKFAGAELLTFLQGDEDYAKLLDQASPSAVPGNLGYWTNQGYLDRAGGSQVVDSAYTVTAAGKEWFAK
jgi:hypothetical protein